jgi:hypothetical protein
MPYLLAVIVPNVKGSCSVLTQSLACVCHPRVLSPAGEKGEDGAYLTELYWTENER